MLRFVLAALVVACGLAQADQILSNPGFESGSLALRTTDTRFGAGVDWAITNTNCHSGSFLCGRSRQRWTGTDVQPNWRFERYDISVTMADDFSIPMVPEPSTLGLLLVRINHDALLGLRAMPAHA